MRKSKILAVALASALVASVASVSVSALSTDDMKSKKVGICGEFNSWADDVPMTENNGVWEGTVDIPEVTADMIKEAETDAGSGKVSRGFQGINFKVRCDGAWTDSWGDYEPAYDRTYNSQTNCCVKAEVGTHVKINVKLDTTKNSEEAVNNADSDVTAEPDSNWWPVTYTVEVVKDEAPAEESKTESKPAATTPAASTAPATTTPAATTDTAESPATGDTTSAIALVAVVLASLGTAVVMTKKASAKE